MKYTTVIQSIHSCNIFLLGSLILSKDWKPQNNFSAGGQKQKKTNIQFKYAHFMTT